MRGFLIFLAIAFPIVLASPTFWWLVQSEIGAAPSVIIEADGARRDTFIGPGSPWPDWVPLPAGGELTPRAWYSSALGHPATGFGDVTFSPPPEQMIASLTQTLAGDGWNVRSVRYHLAEASIPPQPLTVCTIMARRAQGAGEVTVQYGFQLSPTQHGASVHWIEGPPLSTWPNPDSLPAWRKPQAGC